MPPRSLFGRKQWIAITGALLVAFGFSGAMVPILSNPKVGPLEAVGTVMGMLVLVVAIGTSIMVRGFRNWQPPQ
jgi:hypothetical protein